MRVVLDSNVLLISISRRSQHHPIFQAILSGTITLCVSNSILEEYEEKIGEFWSPEVANNTIETLMKSPYMERFDPRYNWVLIYADPDDDKFADCAIAGNATYLVTNDHHFNVLKTLPFPPFNIVLADVFLEMLLNTEGV
ncbi:MAG: putative toxin-antitoxin system toxin component, PIN family [Saprospiraceae bacterium]|nr:putative toxin-antitoxin system toxin component, PIN family [Saprospiraceae bacterium]